jgi:hypothetical protein
MRAAPTQHIQRCGSAKGEPIGAIFLAELKQRIREVKPGPDGFLYALTDETFGAVLRSNPAASQRSSAKALQRLGLQRPASRAIELR